MSSSIATASALFASADPTRSLSAAGNVPHALTERYERQRASAGLNLAEATQISPRGCGATSRTTRSVPTPIAPGVPRATTTTPLSTSGRPEASSGSQVGIL